MLLNELEQQAKDELEDEKKELAKEVIKLRLIEIEKGERLLAKMKKQYQSLLFSEVEEVFYEKENDNILL